MTIKLITEQSVTAKKADLYINAPTEGFVLVENCKVWNKNGMQPVEHESLYIPTTSILLISPHD